MSFPFPRHRRKVSGNPPCAPLSAGISLILPLPAPSSLATDSLRLTKVLMNVTIENSLGPVQVLISPDDTVADLIKAALAIYHREKRRPFLKLQDPKHYALHYSPFWLQSLKADVKLKNLGSRNFFLCSKPSTLSSCSEEANMTMDPASPLALFVHLPL
ncbi:uncharacterized protein LOC129321188 [Prosopis cineraria]|uniref:uncharacterized protein LOC129321188 n=1 Tax=Prosopis cineraria TaxID=364024 RepID=UPI002410AC89|nr:uncharacterized protein LOC129321188 [Prosopis cineraria]